MGGRYLIAVPSAVGRPNPADDALTYIENVGEPGIGNFNADTYHMSLEEPHTG